MSRVLSTWAALLAAIIVATSVYGGIHFYSPIPFWDQWDGTLGFYKAITEGHYGALWEQHMEHRIVFSRILFWLDYAMFGGRNVFAVVMNYVLSVCVGLVLLHENRGGQTQRYPALFIGSLALGFALLWVQAENLKWGFQSQCIAVYLFAMMAFAQFSRPDGRSSRLPIAILFCVASTLSMGNGIAAFAVMVVQAILQRRPIREAFIVAACGAVTALVYFHGYIKPQLPVDAVAAHIPFVRLKFFIIFMGNPVALVSNSLMASALVGIGSLVIAGTAGTYLFFTRQVTPYRAFLIASYGFVIASTLGAANSRWVLGLGTAVSGRYTTPVTISFAVLALLVLDIAATLRTRLLASVCFLALLTYVASYQFTVTNDNSYLYNWKLAVLGQKIGLDRTDYDQFVYPLSMHDKYVEDADFAADYEVGPYSRGWLRDAGVVKFDPTRQVAQACQGHLEATSAANGIITVSGWAAEGNAHDLLIVIVDSTGKTIGYGVTGYLRPDVAKAIKGAPEDAGWTGFADVKEGPISAYVYSHGKFCKLP